VVGLSSAMTAPVYGSLGKPTVAPS
jgi:hypothetical protein